MAEDLDTAKVEFRAKVEEVVSDAKGLKPVLDELIEWSGQNPDVRFVWHEGEAGRERQSLVKCRSRRALSHPTKEDLTSAACVGVPPSGGSR